MNPPVSSDYILQEAKPIIAGFYNKLKKAYKDFEFKKEEELGLIYQDYLDYAMKKYSTIKTLLYKNEGKYLYNFYEHVDLESHYTDSISTENTENIFTASKNIILSGTGGIGKSMLVKHIFLDQINRGTSVPVFIELKSLNDFNNEEKTLIDFIYSEVSNHHLKLSQEYFLNTLEFGRYTIIFDGLDEVISSKRGWLDNSIKSFVSLYEKNRYVISSRPSEEFIGWQSFVEYKLKRLTKNQSLALINKLDYDIKIKKQFAKELKNHLYDNHESFASIPLLLTIMLITFEAGASIPDNLTDFYSQAFYTLYQRHDASKSGYKRELKAKLALEEFKAVLSYIGMKTFINGQVDFDVSVVSGMIAKYSEKNNIQLNSDYFIHDATNSACMMIQEGTNLKFSHRSFQEFFAALGIVQLDDNLQSKILVQWVKVDSNNVSAHKTFLNSLFSIQKERTFKNLCIPIIKMMETQFFSLESIEKINESSFKYFTRHQTRDGKEELRFQLTESHRFYFSLEFLIFSNLGIDILSISDYLKMEEYEKKILLGMEPDERKYYEQFNDLEKIILNQWVEEWYLRRHTYLLDWADGYIRSVTTRKRTLQSLMEEI
ncbi:NACHT domain-containing protein [Streptococcus suis]|uniref:NACHT domain-containing protein n=1 Tax=Streptococcus suis TaxID=1307 RepID=UPI0038B8BB03